jgi:hypothetical protein
MMPQQQPMPQQIDDQVYREQANWPQMPQMPQQQQQQQVMIPQQQPAMPQAPKQPINAAWPEKLPKPIDEKVATHKKEPQHKDSEYSEEYAEADETQPDGDDVTTTEAPKKVKLMLIFLRFF